MLIQTLILAAADPRQLAAFYSDIMELPVKISAEKIVISAGRSELVFEKTKGNDHPFYHFAFNIPANKIEEARDWMKARVELLWIEGYKSDIADFVNWHAKSVYFFDPAGNIVELIARFDLNNAADEPFSAKQLLSISEAGLVFSGDEFEQQAGNIATDYKLSFFAKQPPLPHFRVLGDDEGLFIMVPAQRDWFPTKQPAAIFPMEIRFSDKEKSYNWKNG